MKFHKFMGITAIVLLIAFIISSIVFTFTAKRIYGNFGYSMKYFIDIPDNNSTESYDEDRIIISDSQTFDPLNNLDISCTSETIEFTYEDRDDILIDYYYEKPNHQVYKIKVDLYDANNTIYINATSAFNHYQHFTNYNKVITIHVPEGHHFDSFKLNKDVGDIQDSSVPENTANIDINLDAGNIIFNQSTPVDELLVSANAATLNIKTEEDVNDFNLTCDFGDVTITTEQTCNDLKINTNAASITYNAHDTVNHVDINSDFGDLTGNLYGHINKLIADLDAGDLVFNTYANDDSSAYINVDLGEISSDLPQVKKSNDPNFIITANLGSVTINRIQ